MSKREYNIQQQVEIAGARDRLASDLRTWAARYRAFVRQLDAPTMHKALTDGANLMIAAADELDHVSRCTSFTPKGSDK